MPLSAEYTSVDTIQVRPGNEAFSSGQLLMGDQSIGTPDIAGSMADNPVVLIMTALSILLFILYFKRLTGIFKLVHGGIFRWKEIVNLEDNMGQIRDRNVISSIMIIPFCLVISRYGLYSPRFFSYIPEMYQPLAVVAVFLVFAFFRSFLIRMSKPRRMRHDTWTIASRTSYNFFILATLGMVLTSAVMSAIGISDTAAGMIILYEILIWFAIMAIRRTQILAYGCNEFTAFLYLCGLEILPAGLLAASALLL